jgi:hypothetical protein
MGKETTLLEDMQQVLNFIRPYLIAHLNNEIIIKKNLAQSMECLLLPIN